MPTQLDIFGVIDDGSAGRDKGMAQALAHAEDVVASWGEMAYGYLQSYPQARFITAELREWATEHGLPLPTTAWAWGSVITRAVRAGLIEQDGFDQHGDATSHKKVVPVWRRK